MPRLFLVRHGQASFGSDDYDRLSALGQQQCHQLGAHWQREGLAFLSVMRGTLRRHVQSLEAVQRDMDDAPVALALPGLNEYDSEALIAALALQPAFAAPLERVLKADKAQAHFRRLRAALLQWMRADIEPDGMPSYGEFRAGVVDALDRAHRACRQGDVLIVSSGGPISMAVAHVLGAPDETAVALNMRLRNSAVTELASTARGFELLSFNALPHLEGDALSHTHA